MNNFDQISEVAESLKRRGISCNIEIVENKSGYRGVHIIFKIAAD